MNYQTRKIVKNLIKQIEDFENVVQNINYRGPNAFVLEQMYKLTSRLEKMQHEIDELGALEVQKADKVFEQSGNSIITQRIKRSVDTIQSAVFALNDAISDFYDRIDDLEEGHDIDLSEYSLAEVHKYLKEV